MICNKSKNIFITLLIGLLVSIITNIPIIMNNIIDNYLEFAIKNHFNYLEYKPDKVSIRR